MSADTKLPVESSNIGSFWIAAVLAFGWALLIIQFLPKGRRTKALRLIAAAACITTTLAGLGILCYGAAILLEALTEAPARDRGYFFGVGFVVFTVGSLVAGSSVRWFIHATRPMGMTRR